MFRSLERAVRACLALSAVLCAAGCGQSLGDIQGPTSAKVGETVLISSEGTLWSKADDVTMIYLLGYDDGQVLGDMKITEVVLDGGTQRALTEEPPWEDEGVRLSNAVEIQHDRGKVDYRVVAEVTCIAPGEVVSANRPSVLFGLHWMYEDGDSGGNLNREHGDLKFTCEE